MAKKLDVKPLKIGKSEFDNVINERTIYKVMFRFVYKLVLAITRPISH
jgi:hypothetical protein